jgi:hypothetical protein
MSGIMSAKDAVFGSAASCYVTIDGTRYNFANCISLEAKAEKSKVEVPILGSMSKGNKAAGIQYSGSMTMHYNTSIMRELMEKYALQGIDTYFDIQVTVEDKTTSIGRQTTTLKDCNFDSLVIAKFDADGEYLDEDVDFTFESWSLDESFNTLSVMTTA